MYKMKLFFLLIRPFQRDFQRNFNINSVEMLENKEEIERLQILVVLKEN